MEEVDVIIDADGKVRVEVRGAKGKTCLDITKALEQYLGGQVERELTDEYNQEQEDQDWQTQGND